MNSQDINENLQKNKQKLKVTDYVFEIDGKDISKAEVEYDFIKLTSVSYKNGKKDKVEYLPAISIEVSGIDSNNLVQLNSYSNVPTDITKFLSDCEAFIKKPDMNHSRELDLYFPTNTVTDIYHNLTSIWVVKKDVNIFIFKVCIPTDNLFAYFEVNFNDEKGE